MELKAKLKLEAIVEAQNVAELLGDDDLQVLGKRVVEDFEKDDASRAKRKDSMVAANKLAMLIKEDKTFPWPGAANVKFPLLTIAALQFSARAYPALISGTEIVKCRTVGDDPAGEKTKRAKRVAQHMSYQVLEQDIHWEEEQDRLLMTLPIAGCVVKKTVQDTVLNRPVSTMVLPINFVVPYYTKSLEEAERKSEILFKTPRQIANKARQGEYLEIDLVRSSDPLTKEMMEMYKERGLNPATDDEDATRILIEQHRYIDLDGDGYAEPYCVTVDHASEAVLRIIPSFTMNDIETDKDSEMAELVEAGMQMIVGAAEAGDTATVQAVQAQMQDDLAALKKQARILHINPIEYYTKYSFIPSPDGSFYDLGFGDLLNPINESVNTIINQLLDAGSLQTAAGGFLGRGAKIKGGSIRFKPFEWHRLDTPGADLKNNIVPLPVNPPSPVLFELLSLLVSYANRLSAVSDMMTGETPGQNTPASVALSSLEQGLKVYTGVFKRVYRAMRSEFQKIYRLNSLYLDEKEYFTVLDTGESMEVLAQDYAGDPTDVVPAADPTVASDELMVKRAEFVAARASTVPGYNTAVTERELLKAMKVPNVDQLYPIDENGQPVIQPPPNPDAVQMEAEETRRMAEAQWKIKREATLLTFEVAEKRANIALIMAKAATEAVTPELEAARVELDKADQRLQALLAVLEDQREKEKIDNDRQKAAKSSGD